MARVVIHGSGPMARLAHAYLRHGGHEVVAFSGADSDTGDATLEASLPRVPFEDLASSYPPGEHGLFIAPGRGTDRTDRWALIERARATGYELVTYVHPSASVWPGTEVGENGFILERVVIQPWASLGVDVTVWSGSHIGHETVVGDHCFLSAGTVVSGNVVIEPGCHIGPNASIRNSVTLARGTRIGANVTLRTSTEAERAYAAAPTSSSRAAG